MLHFSPGCGCLPSVQLPQPRPYMQLLRQRPCMQFLRPRPCMPSISSLIPSRRYSTMASVTSNLQARPSIQCSKSNHQVSCAYQAAAIKAATKRQHADCQLTAGWLQSWLQEGHFCSVPQVATQRAQALRPNTANTPGSKSGTLLKLPRI